MKNTIIPGLLAVAIVVSCDSRKEFDSASKPVVASPVVEDSAACKEAGGMWRKVCIGQHYKCVLPYADGGKQCQDSSECEGKCIVRMETICNAPGDCIDPVIPQPGTSMFGTCQVDDDPCGTVIEIEKGIAQEAISID